MPQGTNKKDAKQKNKQGFDSAVIDTEFGKEMGSHDTNKKHKNKAKKEKAPKNDGKYQGGL